MANSTINQLEYHGTLYDVEDTAARTGLETKADTDDVNAALSGKVDKVSGKGLSTNDYTTAEKTKLAGIAEGAEVNVQSDWNQTTTTADDYIKNKPTIPTVNDSTITIQKNRVTVDSFTTNAATGKTINITVPTTASEVDALPDTTKYGASLSLTIDSSTYVVTAQLKDQNGDNLGQAQTIDLPLESVVVSGSYDSQTKKVVLTLQSGSTVEFSVADLVAGLQSEITANNKLSSDLVDDTNATHKFVTASEKNTWNSKQDALSQAQLSAVNSGATTAKIDQIETNKNNILLLEQMNGAKNLAKVATGTRTGSGYFFVNETSKIIDSNTSVYIVFDYELESGQASVQLTDNNGNVITNTSVYTTAGTTSGHKAAKVTLTKAAYGYNAYYNSTGAVTISNMMIIPAEIYDAGFTDYQPYAPTNAELYAMIQALQS